MQAHGRRKNDRQRAVDAHRDRLVAPCGCIPILRTCHCHPDNCVCEIDLEWIDEDSGDICQCEWSLAETIQFQETLGSILAIIDPGHYATPPTPPCPQIVIGSGIALEVMRRRAADGHHIRHPDDVHPEQDWREGDLGGRGANGVARRLGVGSVSAPRHEARWAKT